MSGSRRCCRKPAWRARAEDCFPLKTGYATVNYQLMSSCRSRIDSNNKRLSKIPDISALTRQKVRFGIASHQSELIRQTFNERFVGHSKLFLSSNAFFTRGRRVKFLRIHALTLGDWVLRRPLFRLYRLRRRRQVPIRVIDDAAEPWAGAERASQYFPKGTDLNAHDPEDLAAVAAGRRWAGERQLRFLMK